jgi:hypothetical protein
MPTIAPITPAAQPLKVAATKQEKTAMQAARLPLDSKTFLRIPLPVTASVFARRWEF